MQLYHLMIINFGVLFFFLSFTCPRKHRDRVRLCNSSPIKYRRKKTNCMNIIKINVVNWDEETFNNLSYIFQEVDLYKMKHVRVCIAKTKISASKLVLCCRRLFSLFRYHCSQFKIDFISTISNTQHTVAGTLSTPIWALWEFLASTSMFTQHFFRCYCLIKIVKPSALFLLLFFFFKSAVSRPLRLNSVQKFKAPAQSEIT